MGDRRANPLLEAEPNGQPVLLQPNGSHLHPGVDGRADGTAEGIPYLVVEPFNEFIPSIVVEVLGRAEVEVGIKLMNNWPRNKNDMN